MIKVRRLSFEQVQMNRCAAAARLFREVGLTDMADFYVKQVGAWASLHVQFVKTTP